MNKQPLFHRASLRITALIACITLFFCSIVLMPKVQAMNSITNTENNDSSSVTATQSDASTGSESDSLEAYASTVDSTSVIVENLQELKWALTNNTIYTTVYLGADITLDNQNIVIPGNKSHVIIDGTPPGRTRHTLTTNGAYSGILYVTQYNMRQVTLQNMDIINNSNNNLVYVPVSLPNAVVVYDNVTFRGSEAAYNPGGMTRIRNSTFDLESINGSTVGEVAESRYVELDGIVDINVPTTRNAVFWLKESDSTLKILPDADVTVSTSYYFVYTSDKKPNVTLEPGAKLSLTSKRFGFTYAAQSVGSFMMGEGSELFLDLQTNESYAALRVDKQFQMEPGSSATILRTGKDGIPLRLTRAGAQAIFNEPKQVFLYSSSGVPLRFTGAGTLSITTSTLNVWNNTAWPIPASVESRPDHIWNKADNQRLSLEAVYNGITNRSIDHNLSDEDPLAAPLIAANFNLEKNQLIAFGDISLSIDSLTQQSSEISGTAISGAELEAEYPLEGGSIAMAQGTAAADGTYSLPISGGPLAADGVVTVISHSNDLWMRQNTTVTAAGELSFLTLPEHIDYGSIPVPLQQTVIPPESGMLPVVVSDQRPNPSAWHLDITADPLTAIVNGQESIISNALVFAETGQAPITLGPEPVTIYRNESGLKGDTEIRWEDGNGIWLNLNPGSIYSGVEYQTKIYWTLVSAP